jgi:hypothetical protein
MATDDHAEARVDPLVALPVALARELFARLPVDVRLRCREVSLAWRDALAERSLWTALVLAPTHLQCPRLSSGLVRAAAARADGHLTYLFHKRILPYTVDDNAALLDVARANAGALRWLTVGSLSLESAVALLAAAPSLHSLDALRLTTVTIADAFRVLRKEPPFEPLCVHFLSLDAGSPEIPADVPAATVVSLLGDVASYEKLKRLQLECFPLNTPGVMDALMNAASTRRLTTLSLTRCDFEPGTAAALARFVAQASLQDFRVAGMRGVQLDAPAAALLGDALRANRTLTSLCLGNWTVSDDPAAFEALLTALTGHPSVHFLELCLDRVRGEDAAAVGALLGALIAADAPALEQLFISVCDFDEDLLGPSVDAMARNTHVWLLGVEDAQLSEAFARERLLPAVRANTGLRLLDINHANSSAGAAAAIAEAEALVQARRQAGAV